MHFPAAFQHCSASAPAPGPALPSRCLLSAIPQLADHEQALPQLLLLQLLQQLLNCQRTCCLLLCLPAQVMLKLTAHCFQTTLAVAEGQQAVAEGQQAVAEGQQAVAEEQQAVVEGQQAAAEQALQFL